MDSSEEDCAPAPVDVGRVTGILERIKYIDLTRDLLVYFSKEEPRPVSARLKVAGVFSAVSRSGASSLTGEVRTIFEKHLGADHILFTGYRDLESELAYGAARESIGDYTKRLEQNQWPSSGTSRFASASAPWRSAPKPNHPRQGGEGGADDNT